MDGGPTFEQRRAAVREACVALTGMSTELWAAGGADLGELMSVLDELAVRVDSARVDLLREAVDRGEAGAVRAGASAWLLDHSPSLRAGGSARVVRVAEASSDDRYAALMGAVRDARVPLVTAAMVVDEFERLRPRLADGAEGPVMDGLVDVASWGRAKDVRGLRERLVAKYGLAGELQAEHDRACERRSLSQAFADGTGLFEYTMVVDAEAKAVIERRIACDAGIVPVVLGKEGGNAALLCGRHHTVVHRKGYYAELRDGRVSWVLLPGAYDHWLADRQAASADRVATGRDRPPVRVYDVWDQLESAAVGPQSSPPWRP